MGKPQPWDSADAVLSKDCKNAYDTLEHPETSSTDHLPPLGGPGAVWHGALAVLVTNATQSTLHATCGDGQELGEGPGAVACRPCPAGSAGVSGFCAPCRAPRVPSALRTSRTTRGPGISGM